LALSEKYYGKAEREVIEDRFSPSSNRNIINPSSAFIKAGREKCEGYSGAPIWSSGSYETGREP
jgi:hypothetical protein